MVPAVDHVSYDSVHVCATPLTAHCSVVQEVAVLNESVRQPGCKAAADLLCHVLHEGAVGDGEHTADLLDASACVLCLREPQETSQDSRGWNSHSLQLISCIEGQTAHTRVHMAIQSAADQTLLVSNHQPGTNLRQLKTLRTSAVGGASGGSGSIFFPSSL